MQRDLFTDLLKWKNSASRKPLVLQGARQVGKTYLLREFGATEFKHCVYLNFEQDNLLAQFFEHTLDPIKILDNLSLYLDLQIKPEQTLIIFDEVQECPRALNSLKYFQEQAPEYHIAAAGSLLGVKLINKAGFPVGKVNFLDLFPLSFMEFLNALGKEKLRTYLEDLNNADPIPEPLHQELLNLLRRYMMVGGMPEAVLKFIETNDLNEVRKIQYEILRAYDLDFAKHAPKAEIMRISQVWQSIPRQLAKENSKFVFNVVREGARGRDYELALQWLLEAGLILKSYNLTTPQLPFPAFGDTNAFKVFMLDVGLLAAMCQIPLKLVAIDQQLFLNEFNGAITENYVAQSLSKQRHSLYYWTSAATAEVDFIVEFGGNIYPLGVKSGTSKRKKSLQIYATKYNPELLLRVSSLNLKLDGKVCNLPLYLCSQFARFL
jgi:predicted AAA+ superfamily ATPase